MRFLPSSIAVACSLLIAACGGDDGGGGDAEKEITDMLTAGLTSRDVAVICEGSLSPDLIKRIYGDTPKCHTAEKEDLEDSKRAKSVSVSGVKVDGDKATATIALKGGDQDGATGALTLVEAEPGWRVNDFSTALLRSEFEASMKTDTEVPAGLKDCIGKEVLGLGDSELRELAYGAMGNQPAADKQLTALVTECASESAPAAGGDPDAKPSVLRQQFEKGIAESLDGDGVRAEAIECVKRELRSRITDKQIAEAVGAGRENLPEDVTAATAAAMGECDAT